MKTYIFIFALNLFLFSNLIAFAQSTAGNNNTGGGRYLGFNGAQDLEFRINSNEHMRLLHTSGLLGINLSTPSRRLHVHGTDTLDVEGVLVTNTATGSAASDGLLLGTVGDDNTGLIRWGENSNLNIQQGGFNRMRLTRYTYGGYNAVGSQTGVSRILLPLGGTAPGGGLSNNYGFSLLHMGTTSGLGGNDETNTLRRPWLNIGTTYTGGADIFYVGLLQSPKPESTVNHVDAVLAWGCNEGQDEAVGPDYFRILFYKPEEVSPINDASEDQGRECVRITPFGNMGVGDFSHMPNGLDIDPLMRLHVSGGVLATGNVGANPNLGAGRRLMWIPEDAAFRAGEALGGEWASVNVGHGSFAAGKGLTASGDWSFALGESSTVSGDASSSFGYGNTVSGDYSMAFGKSQVITGELATAIGCLTSTTADGSITIGRGFGALSPLTNNVEKSIMMGMNSNVPTMFIGDSGGAGLWSNVGFGNITAPTHLIDANGNARFRQMPSTTGNVLITGVQESGAGDYSLSTKSFGLVGQYLDGTGAWVNMPPAEQCDWNLNGQDIIMGYAGSTPVAACRSGNVGIGTHVPTGGKLTVQHTNGTSVYARMGGTAASINSMHAKTSVGANSQESVAVRADNSLNTSCSSPYNESVAYGLKAYANNGEKNFAVFAEAIPHIYPGNELDTCASYESSWAGYFNGATFSPGGVWTASDEQLKTDINDAPNASELLAQISPKTYSFNHANFPGLNLPRGTHWGIMAQNLEDLVPSAVTNMVHPALLDSTGAVIQSEQAFKAVNYTELIPILIQGHKELAAEKNELKAEVDALKDLVNELTALVQNCCTSGGDKSLQGSGSTSSPTADGADFDLQIEKAYLGQNVPNPFQYETSITYRIPAQAMVRVRVMDAKGQQVDTLVDGLMPKGEYKIIWNASHLPGGLYFYTLEADGIELVKKAVKL